MELTIWLFRSDKERTQGIGTKTRQNDTKTPRSDTECKQIHTPERNFDAGLGHYMNKSIVSMFYCPILIVRWHKD